MISLHRSAAVLAVVALAAVPSVQAFASYVSPKSITLSPSDVPSNLKVSTAHYVSNAQMAKKAQMAKSLFDSHGRITGYNVEYTSSGKTGLAFVASYANVYKSAAGAAWDYSESVVHTLKGIKKVSGPTIGDASTSYGDVVKTGGSKVALFGVDFRRGSVSMTVGVGGLPGQVHLSDADRLAQKMLARVK